MRPAVTALASMLLALLSACGGSSDGGTPGTDAGEPPADAAAVDAVRVEIGTGRTTFVEIPEAGAALELIAGPQGGWHVDLTARLYGLTVEGLLLTYEISRDGTVISMPRQFMLREALVVPEGDHYLRLGDFVPFAITEPADVVGDTVVVKVIAEDTTGARAEDSRTVRIVDDE